MLRCGFLHNRLATLDLLPYRINDNCQTIPLEGQQGQTLLNKVFDISGWKKQGITI